METKPEQTQLRCVGCGRYFRPNKRVGARQKCCTEKCQRTYQRKKQAAWRSKNPDYFKGRYEYVKEWRKNNPGYQKEWRQKHVREIQSPVEHLTPIKSIRLNMRSKCVVREIQTLVLTLIKSGQSLWVSGARMQPG